MRVIATSDLHGHLPEIPECDILVLGGDICPDHPIGKNERYGLPDNGGSFQLAWLDQELRPWLKNVPADHILAIWGNHDFVGEKLRSAVAELHLPWTLLEDQEVTVNGLRIFGTPWVPGLPRWAFHASETALKWRAQAIPRDLDILISHGPPYGILDKTVPMFGNMHVGDKSLRDELDRLAPKVLVCGHIHEQFGSYQHNDTLVLNVSINDEHYNPHRPVVELDTFKDRQGDE